MGYSSSKDHSKWGVSLDGNVPAVCIGDVNRQESQFKRGGGAVCIEDKNMWKTFYNSIGSYVDCKNNFAQVTKFKSDPSPWTSFSPKFDLFN
ncbi:hypothetical protein OESDEN_11184 [Oesophagostomum dentatum]|uniref:Uncharacterized protein n=1 Tax=Oesophagostomum dentatum TaxID=61180 RepID=A0A0B1SUL3_OESDE|nr:hypothetical protein OESDEN_11184 [Oesophagostomum dentatum]